jgi:hypothetical protein
LRCVTRLNTLGLRYTLLSPMPPYTAIANNKIQLNVILKLMHMQPGFPWFYKYIFQEIDTLLCKML